MKNIHNSFRLYPLQLFVFLLITTNASYAQVQPDLSLYEQQLFLQGKILTLPHSFSYPFFNRQKNTL